MNDLIGRTLKAGLLESVGDDPERVKHLRSAAAAVGSEIKNEPDRLPHALLTAVYEDAPSSSPAFLWAREAILNEWETFENAFAETPYEILRIVLLEAACKAFGTSKRLRFVAWYILRTGLELLPVSTWREVLEDLLTDLDEKVHAELDQDWRLDPDIPMVRMPSVSEGGFNAQALRNLSGENMRSKTKSVLSNTGNVQQLTNQLPDLLDVIVNATKQDLAALGEADHERLSEVVTKIGSKLRDALNAQERLLKATARRSDLLWWRTTLWSTSRGMPYRDFDTVVDAAVVASVDLHNLVPNVAPEAVEKLLEDVIDEMADDGDGGVDVEFGDFAASIERFIEDGTSSASSGPLPVLDIAIAKGRNDEMLEGAPQSFVDPRPLKDYAVVTFRDLQVRSLLNE